MLTDSFKRQLPALRAAALIALSTALLHITACASRTPAPGSNAAPGASLPAADGTGLQIITWTIDNTSTLTVPAANETAAVAPRMQEAWQSANMLIARVRVSDVEAIARSVALTTPPQQQLLAFSPLRSEAMRGDATAYDLLRLESGTMPLRNAAARMLIRGWPVPSLPAQIDATTAPSPLRSAVHIELVPQVLSLTRPRRTGLEPIDNSPESQGVVLSRLVLETTLLEGEALIIYPAQAPTPSEATRMRTQAENANVPAPQPAPRRPSAGTDNPDAPPTTQPDTLVVEAEEAGPAIPTAESLPTFGDALLTDALATPIQGTRRVLIIIPKPPATYSLLRPR
jgi:hypothetical protein